jgi:hypothetical protein
MKQVIVNVDEKKYKFFMELLKNLDFVSVQKEDEAKNYALKQIAEGMHTALLASKGKTNARSAKSFLNEL